MDKILRINMKTKDVLYEDVSEQYSKLGGRGLIAKILLNEVKPTCDPLGRYNKLIFATGFLTGSLVSSASRISIGAKSPLTGGIKESNAGGITAMRLAQNGVKAVIVEEIPEENNWYYIKISKNSCTLESADEYKGMGTFEFCNEMLKKYPNCAVTCIGSSGERLYGAAAIATMDKENNPNRYSGRGGLGAVMGSKYLKGIVVTDKGSVEISDKEEFSAALKQYSSVVKDAPSSLTYKSLGTASTSRVTNEMNGLPVNNFSGEKFQHLESISGEALYELIESRGGEGKTAHACMPGCIIQCSNVVPDENGKTIVSPLEYETIGLMGSNLGIGNLEIIAKLNAICNDIGIDTIETGAAIGVAMEAGIIEFGDGEGALRLMEEIKEGTVLGRVLGNGVEITGKVFGVRHIPVVNGQAMPAYDPRAIKGMGVTYATSPMGADHTYGAVIKTRKPYAQASRESQILLALYDTLGICMFARGAVGKNYELLVNLINAKNGWNIDSQWLMKIAEDTIRDEHKFNQLAGFTNKNYRMNESFEETEIADIQAVFDVSDEDLDKVLNSFK
ncbi:MAG: aldehyde ferredoxin oxidoreductase [Tissierellia bacterium]|nr:aldehyde ferredoxin oxidoreductase [Tissierellia bacterium]